METSEKRAWYRMDTKEIEVLLRANIQSGLSQSEVDERLLQFGANELRGEKRRSLLNRIVDEFRNPLTLTLFFAGVATLLLHDVNDAIIIYAALVVNIAIDLYQEGRASSAFDKLRHAQDPYAMVLREGDAVRIAAKELVPGDVMLIGLGVTIPADARIIESVRLEVNESVLTGEWEPVQKRANIIEGDAELYDQKNMLFMGTMATSGSAKAIVTATGMRTNLGAIAERLGSTKKTQTPLEKAIARLARIIGIIILVAILIVTMIGVSAGESLTNILLVAIALSVAAIPEGMPAAVSVTLALAMQRILEKGGLVRSMLAAEALGSTTVIVTDKTGTLTEGKMSVARVLSLADVESLSWKLEDLTYKTPSIDAQRALEWAYVAGDAIVQLSEGEAPKVHGIAVEAAIAHALLLERASVAFLKKTGVSYAAHVPFNSEFRFSASIAKLESEHEFRLYSVGAAEEMLARATQYYKDGRTHHITKEIREKLSEFLDAATGQGARVVLSGYEEAKARELPENPEELTAAIFGDHRFVFGAFILLVDPLRSDVPASIREARGAGARVIMATGDNQNTARAIALAAGIVHDKELEVLLGIDTEKMEDEELRSVLSRVKVFARMLPMHKERIARLLTEDGEVVAMTGDGVNDAPALRAASIGVALGTGTDVAKEASGLVLTNNSFTVIIKAIEEGRRAVDNIRKSVAYLLSTSFAEIALIGGAMLVGVPLPLLPAQVLWTNMLTEGFMNFAFATEQAEKGVMNRDPRKHGAHAMFTRRFFLFIGGVGVINASILIGFFAYVTMLGASPEDVRTHSFVVLTLLATFIAIGLKDLSTPLWRINIFNNQYLFVSMGIALAGLAAALYIPVLAKFLHLNPLAIDGFAWHYTAAVAVMLAGVEVCKFVFLRK